MLDLCHQRKFAMKQEMLRAKKRRWRAVVGCRTYEVSNDGRVRLHATKSLIAPSFSKQGRPRYHLPYCGGYFHADAHVLVALAFLPPAPIGKPWVLHRDDDPLNCVDTNLRWGDRWDNAEDRELNGRRRAGLKISPVEVRMKRSYSIKPAKVLAIYRAAGSHSSVAAKFGVSRSAVTKIKSGERRSGIFPT